MMTELPASWVLVVPVKHTSVAKSRLAGIAGGRRVELALAMAADTVAAAAACPLVTKILVVTDDELAAKELSALGAQVVPDTPAAGLNPALAHGAALARRARPESPVAALSCDLPALRPAELATALQAAGAHPTAFVADTAGTGTTLYAAAARAAFAPCFGERSRTAHGAGGAVELELVDVATLRRDVDTEVDLWDAARLGLGVRTARIAAELGADS